MMRMAPLLVPNIVKGKIYFIGITFILDSDNFAYPYLSYIIHFMTTTKHFKIVLFGLLLCTFVNGQPRFAKEKNNLENISSKVKQEQKWWNLLHYDIAIRPDYEKKSVAGTNSLTFISLETNLVMQIDLQEPMQITGISWRNKNLVFQRNNKNTYLITFPVPIKAGDTETITIEFKGHPKESSNPPFDSGWIWARDEKNRPWISVVCEGSGASIWFPCKDVLYCCHCWDGGGRCRFQRFLEGQLLIERSKIFWGGFSHTLTQLRRYFSRELHIL